jgi:RNA polymerase primary sigma factor
MPPLRCEQGRGAQPPFETYLRDINKTPLLSAAEERELAYRVEEGDGAARDRMVRANLRLVVNIARSYAGRGLPLEDLIAEGNLGLVRAVEGFDPSMGVRFSTYASYWIKQSIKRAVINTAKAVRLPAYMHELLTKWKRAQAALQEELGRPPTPEEVALQLGLSRKKLQVILKAIRVYTAGQHHEGPGEGWGLEELLSDQGAGMPEHRLARTDDLQQVLRLLGHLEDREAAVLRLRFGLGSGEPKTLKEIGERLGLTRERVRQIEGDALDKLRDLLEEGA